MEAVVRPGDLAALVSVFPRLVAGESLALLPFDAEPERTDPPPGAGPWLGVTSSGSTGRAKLVWRDWPGLLAAASRKPDAAGWRWASPYQPQTFAGMQVALQAWVSGGTIRSLGGDWDGIWRTLAREAIEAVSATPTFMDLLLQNEPVPAVDWAPRQLTLGGEPLRAPIGARLRNRFPQTRCTVIYASAELGLLLKTGRLDGWYEADFLDQRWAGWRIEQGVLEVNDGTRWWRTGDEVVAEGPLLKVVGRADAVANVAGTKVSLAEVAERAEEVPGVRRAVAVARENPVTGQVVALKYALDSGAVPADVERELQAHLRRTLRKEAWPRLWEPAEIGATVNAKRAVR